jgi:hypothetical protein
MPKNVIRFAVADDITGCHSASWRIWQKKKGDVYLSCRVAGHRYKISLHVSRICRYAESKESAGGPRKAEIRWIRPETPSFGNVYAVNLLFPTNYLGRSQKPLEKEILRVPPAPAGNATAIGVFFTRDNPESVIRQMGTTAKLISEIPTSDKEFCGIAAFNFSGWQDLDIIVPASHHEMRELRFTAALPEGAERTFSLMLPRRPDLEGAPLVLTEIYGYAVPPGTGCVQLTEPHAMLSRSEIRKVWSSMP